MGMTVKEFIETFTKNAKHTNCTIYPCGADINKLKLSDVKLHYNHYALGWITNIYDEKEIQFSIDYSKKDYENFGDLWIRKYIPTEKWNITPEKLLSAEVDHVYGNSDNGGLAIVIKDYQIKQRDDINE